MKPLSDTLRELKQHDNKIVRSKKLWINGANFAKCMKLFREVYGEL